MRRLDLVMLVTPTGREAEDRLAHRRRRMVEQLLVLIGSSRWLGEIQVSEARTWLAGDWRFYEIPGEPLRLVEEIRWTWQGNVHTFTIEGLAGHAPLAAPTRSPAPAPR